MNAPRSGRLVAVPPRILEMSSVVPLAAFACFPFICFFLWFYQPDAAVAALAALRSGWLRRVAGRTRRHDAGRVVLLRSLPLSGRQTIRKNVRSKNKAWLGLVK